MKNKVTADQINTMHLAIHYARERRAFDAAAAIQNDLNLYVLKALADHGSVLAKLALQEVVG